MMRIRALLAVAAVALLAACGQSPTAVDGAQPDSRAAFGSAGLGSGL